MGYIEKIQSDLTAAMKEKDELRLSVLRMVKSALKLKEIDKMRPLDDLESLQILQTLIKQRKESIEQFTQGGRKDLADKEAAEITLVQGYMPSQLSAAELDALINEAVAAAAKPLAAAGISVLHAHGPKNRLSLPEPAEGEPPYVAVPYLTRMDLAYAAADLAICRSGAMTVAEVSAVGLPAVYVPLPIGNGEQRLNALPVVNAGGGLIVADRDLTPDYVAHTVAGLLTDGPGLAAMTAAAALVGHRDAAQKVAQVALDVAIRARRARRPG